MFEVSGLTLVDCVYMYIDIEREREREREREKAGEPEIRRRVVALETGWIFGDSGRSEKVPHPQALEQCWCLSLQRPILVATGWCMLHMFKLGVRVWVSLSRPHD